MIVNLTQHPATKEQVAAGVFDLEGQALAYVKANLTFNDLPTKEEIVIRADRIADIAADHRADAAMIGGAPYLMAPLEAALIARGIAPLYAFSERVSEEEALADGTVRKVNVFRHVGFVEA